MEKQDEMEVPIFNDSDEADKWYCEVEAKQKQAFTNLLEDFDKKAEEA